VCPKGKGGPSEACFQAHALPFADGRTTIRYEDGTRADFGIAATDVSVGTKPAGSAWRKNPIPMCNCDVGTGCRAKGAGGGAAATVHHVDVPAAGAQGYQCTADPTCSAPAKGPLSGCKRCADPASGKPAWSCAECCPGLAPLNKSGGTYCEDNSRVDMFTAYEVDPVARTKTPECPTGLQFPLSWDEGYGDGGGCLYPQGPNSPHCSPYMWTMVDKVRVPTAPGDYTLSFRWDCEHTPQVWNQCADVTVVA
jgi:hypothetical protein